MPWTIVLSIGLMLLVSSFGGCATKPGPKPADGRPCYLAILTDEQAAWLLLHYSIQARAGDLLIPRACEDQTLEDIDNDVRRLTR